VALQKRRPRTHGPCNGTLTPRRLLFQHWPSGSLAIAVRRTRESSRRDCRWRGLSFAPERITRGSGADAQVQARGRLAPRRREMTFGRHKQQRNQRRPDRKSARPVKDVGAPSERPVGWSGGGVFSFVCKQESRQRGAPRPEHQLGPSRRHHLLRQTSDSPVRLQVTADRTVSKRPALLQLRQSEPRLAPVSRAEGQLRIGPTGRPGGGGVPGGQRATCGGLPVRARMAQDSRIPSGMRTVS